MSVVDGGDHLVASELRAELGNCRIGSEIVVVEETRSTNDLVWAAADRGTPEGFVVFAERQTAGRGQYGRRWESAPHQGIAMSVLLRPAITLRESPRLTSLLAEVIAAVITDETGCAAAIKFTWSRARWPASWSKAEPPPMDITWPSPESGST